MSRTEENIMDLTDFPEIDMELAQMAEDVPPPPEGFHDSWLRAVRAEAAKEETTGEKAKDNEPAGEESGRRQQTQGRRQWISLLSTAAVFLFLIGGTFVYRGLGKGVPAMREKAAAPMAMPAEEMPAATGMPTLMTTPEATLMPALHAAGEAAEEVADAAVFEAAEEADDATYEANANAAYSAETEEAAEEEAEAPEAALTAGEMPADKAAPETVYQTGSAAEADRASDMGAGAVPEGAAEARDESEIILFLRDMGDFLKAAAPYLLGAAAVAAVIVLIRRRKKTGRDS